MPAPQKRYMNCEDFQKLIDSHLDGELAGTLRLEFDAHRVQCDHCEHTVAVLESVTNVISAPQVAPMLSDNFADDVISKIELGRNETRALKYRGLRTVIVAGAIVQAAAVLMFALWPRAASDPLPVTTPPEEIDLASVTPDVLMKYIVDRSAQEALTRGLQDKFEQVKAFGLALNNQQRIEYDSIPLLSAWLAAPEPELEAEASDQFAF